MNPAYRRWQTNIKNSDLRFFLNLLIPPRKNAPVVLQFHLTVTRPSTPATKEIAKSPNKFQHPINYLMIGKNSIARYCQYKRFHILISNNKPIWTLRITGRNLQRQKCRAISDPASLFDNFHYFFEYKELGLRLIMAFLLSSAKSFIKWSSILSIVVYIAFFGGYTITPHTIKKIC
jgi:hypothetical protein